MLLQLKLRTQLLKASAFFYAQLFKKFLPVIFFLGGFVWDAVTLGQTVTVLDLLLLSGYLVVAALILLWLARHQTVLNDTIAQTEQTAQQVSLRKRKLRKLPYLLLQFLYGSLLSALFILYFISAGFWGALVWTLFIAALLVANEYLEESYKRFTLNWGMLGLCTILVFNFVIPTIVGSVHPVWFYISTALGVSVVLLLKHRAEKQYVIAMNKAVNALPPLEIYVPHHPPRIKSHLGKSLPVYFIGFAMIFAYQFNLIPPVPLVKRDVQIGLELVRQNGDYELSQQKAPNWQFWHGTLNSTVVLNPGDRVYCLSAVFAPVGLQTKLYHRWEFKTKQGWQTMSRIGFSVNGGRQQGYRGYTYKQNIQAGKWRVSVETEREQTVSANTFDIVVASQTRPKNLKKLRF